MSSMARQGRRERKKLERREQILASAAELFEQRGFDATSLEAIADAADVSLRTLYNFFPTKLDMLFAGQLRAIQEQIEIALASLGDLPPDPREGLYQLIEAHFRIFDAMDRDLLLRTVVHGLAQGPQTGAGEDYARSDILSMAAVEQVLDIYAKRRKVRPQVNLDALARLIFTAGNGEFFIWLADREQAVDVALAHMRSYIDLALPKSLRSRGAGSS